MIASQNTARSPADGYTLMQGYVATHGTAPATRRLPYDANKDFTAIGLTGGTPNVLASCSSWTISILADAEATEDAVTAAGGRRVNAGRYSASSGVLGVVAFCSGKCFGMHALATLSKSRPGSGFPLSG